MSEILGPPLVPPMTPGEWVSESLFVSSRLAACEPVIRACVASDTAHMLVIGPDACAKK